MRSSLRFSIGDIYERLTILSIRLFIPQNGIVGAQVEAIKLGKGH